jgi:hypothetical protein
VTARARSGYSIGPYTRALQPDWDAFVAGSKNGTFLFLRDYMDYHADRFTDHSLIVRDRSGIVALLPANRVDDEIYSHQGLTYGGLVTCARMTVPVMLSIFDAVLDHLRMAGATVLHYKTIPWIYHRMPAEEDRYALFRAGAELVRRDVLSVVSRLGDSPPVQGRRRRGAAKADKSRIEVVHSQEWQVYWKLLSSHLEARFATQPVHSREEIERLQRRFPDNIKLYVAKAGGEVLAGTVIYESRMVAHVQYIASSESGRQSGALDRLFLDLLGGPFRDKPFFDFGISNQEHGRVLNKGLIEQKEGFGGRAVVHDFYRVTL